MEFSLNIKKNLEKNYFCLSFNEIKSHPQLKELNLTNEEIVENRRLINIVLESYKKCSNDCKLCENIFPHYSIKRNKDQRLILIKEECKKIKNHEKIPDQEINNQIKKLVTSNFFIFEKQEAMKIFKTFPSEEFGDPSYEHKNGYMNPKSENDKKNMIMYLAYHYVLCGKKITILKSNELKEMYIKMFFNKSNQNEIDSKKYQKIKQEEKLIIVDLGLEDISMKQSYYLDFLPEFFLSRKNNKTYIISLISKNDFFKEVKNIKNQTLSKIVFDAKIKELESSMNIFFSRDT